MKPVIGEALNRLFSLIDRFMTDDRESGYQPELVRIGSIIGDVQLHFEMTSRGDSDDRIRGFNSGADIYLVKHSTLREIEAAIRSLLRRTGASTDSTNSQDDRWMLDAINWLLIAPNQHSLKLTATEFAFMNILCSHKGEVCQRDELVETLTRPKASFDNRHLDAIVSRLCRKIESRTHLPAPIKVVYGVGYTFTATTAVQ